MGDYGSCFGNLTLGGIRIVRTKNTKAFHIRSPKPTPSTLDPMRIEV